MSEKLPIKLSKGTIPRTFRLPIEWNEVLEYDADKNNISVSALLNQILNNYIVYQRYAVKNPTVFLSVKNLRNILSEMNDTQIITAARKSGRVIPEESFNIRGLEINYDTFVWFLREVFDKQGNWFSLHLSPQKNEIFFDMTHNYSWKWSLFLKIYFEEFLQNLLYFKTEINTTENSINFIVPRKLFLEKI